VTNIPALKHELVEAKRRLRRRSRRLPRRTAALAACIVVVVSGTAGAVLMTTGTIGGEPSAPYGSTPPEGALRYGAAPVVLAVGHGEGWSFEVVGYRLGERGENSTDLCLDVVLIDGRSRSTSGCFTPTGRAQGTIVGPAGVTVVGATSQDVASVDVRDVRDGHQVASAAVPARAEDREVLSRVGVSDPFTLYVARLPAGARRVQAIAKSPAGEQVWTAEFRVP
jgi:hypothetical protein